MTMLDSFDLTGRTALVTGAGTGLGRQFALTLAGAGADVVLAARRREKLEETADEIAALKLGRALCVDMDVTDRGSIQAAFDEATAGLALPSIVINNAGISREAFALQFPESDWDAVLDTNLKGVFLVAQAAGQRLVQADATGSIVNIASILGRRVTHMLSAYSAAKAGVIRLTESLALEWSRHGIRVNAIAPGFFVTDINREFFDTADSEKMLRRIPMRRPGETHELAGAMLLLASDAGSYMTGSTITVDGGHVCSSL
jgi:NAD(P)-dependent dehydrogenase (short-subunit alcohol dehydrogenase family)